MHADLPADPALAAAPLAAAALAAAVADEAAGASIEVALLFETGSTNDELLARCRAAQPEHPLLLATERQTAGRGRQQRAWRAPRHALLFSLAVPLAPRPALLPPVTLAVGAALAEALAARGVAVQVKWPNDLLLGGRKLAGVLCELALDARGRATLVVGVGTNLHFDAAESATVGQPAAALAEVVPLAALLREREAWIAALACAALRAVHGYAQSGFAPWRARINAHLHARGADARLLDEGRCVAQGRIDSVDDAGRLVLDTAEGLRAFSAGDLSLRAAA